MCARLHYRAPTALYETHARIVLESMNAQNAVHFFRSEAVHSRLIPSRGPHVEGLDYYGICRPAQDVGGEFYDFIPLEHGGMALCLGDVNGNGGATAILKSGLQALVGALTRRRSREIGQVMRELNRA